MEIKNTDVLIVGTGASGLFAALHIPQDLRVLMITKGQVKESDSFLAQGGICMLRDEDDYDSFMEDTLKAGHYENRRESVDIMIRPEKTENWILPERDAIPSQGFCFMKTLQEKRLPVNCCRRCRIFLM